MSKSPSVLPGQFIPNDRFPPNSHRQPLNEKQYLAPPPPPPPPMSSRGYSNDSYLKQSSSLFAGLNTRNQICFLTVILFQSVIVLAMIAAVYATISSGQFTAVQTFSASPKLESIATYLGLFILAEVFQLLTTLDALSQKNILQVLFLLPFQISLLVYSSVLPAQIESALRGSTADTPSIHAQSQALAIVIPSVIGFCTLVMSVLSYFLYLEYGWSTFKLLGADIKLRKYYALFQWFVCLLKFDGFFFIGFSIQFLVLVQGTTLPEFIVTILALPVGIAFLMLGGAAVRYENKTGVYFFLVLLILTAVYFVYKLTRIFSSTFGDRYWYSRKSLAIFSLLSLLMLLLTFATTGLVLLNFGRGLKEAIPPYSWRTRTERRSRSNSGSMTELDGGTSSRMSLD